MLPLRERVFYRPDNRMSVPVSHQRHMPVNGAAQRIAQACDVASSWLGLLAGVATAVRAGSAMFIDSPRMSAFQAEERDCEMTRQICHAPTVLEELEDRAENASAGRAVCYNRPVYSARGTRLR
jgi:hypothetical protein